MPEIQHPPTQVSQLENPQNHTPTINSQIPHNLFNTPNSKSPKFNPNSQGWSFFDQLSDFLRLLNDDKSVSYK